jgi:hypothetical protein
MNMSDYLSYLLYKYCKRQCRFHDATKMSAAVYSVLKELRILSLSLPAVVKKLLADPSDNLVTAISECALNVYKNSEIELTPQQHKSLGKYQTQIIFLADKKVSLKRKTQLLRRNGYKFVPLLLQAVLDHVERIRTLVAK